MPAKKVKQPLSVTHPELAKEADGWDPANSTLGSNVRRSWVCPFGHRWLTSISNRVISKTGCPICGGKKLLVGFNDLGSKFPQISKEACGWDPTTFLSGSNKVVDWICPLQHKYSTRISHRTSRNIGCPYCSNHSVLQGFNDLATTAPELAAELLELNPSEIIGAGSKLVNWQCPIGHRYEMRISDRRKGDGCPYCSNRRVLVGYNDLATTHPDIAEEADGWDPRTVVAGSNSPKRWRCKFGHKWSAQPNNRRSGSGCPYCSYQKVWPGFNDLKTTHPMLASQAIDWDPECILSGNEKIRSWRCPKGHIFRARAKDLVAGKSCGVCANRQVQVGYNDLASRFPEIAKQADGWDPTQVLFGSNRKFSWVCDEGHKWKTVLINRTLRGDGCPSCAKFGYDPNKDAYLYFLHHTEWKMFQIGITNVPETRLSKHLKLGWQVLELRGPMDGHLTQQWETAILRMLKAKGADLSNDKIAGKFDGYSEAWSKATFVVSSIKDLMRLTEEFES